MWGGGWRWGEKNLGRLVPVRLSLSGHPTTHVRHRAGPGDGGRGLRSGEAGEVGFAQSRLAMALKRSDTRRPPNRYWFVCLPQ